MGIINTEKNSVSKRNYFWKRHHPALWRWDSSSLLKNNLIQLKEIQLVEDIIDPRWFATKDLFTNTDLCFYLQVLMIVDHFMHMLSFQNMLHLICRLNCIAVLNTSFNSSHIKEVCSLPSCCASMFHFKYWVHTERNYTCQSFMSVKKTSLSTSLLL